ncbi:TPA: hypothetical protein ACGWJO_004157 [Salmonella enterica]|uniref:hypothetical protein n=1 Tax=Salmonella enterica TaxID=28901 RepID=UPI001F1464ED|nr:hypothetical protein [Salmonella enterica]UMY44808.1 hypothetical protein MLB75_04795 [Salmonella enterica]
MKLFCVLFFLLFSSFVSAETLNLNGVPVRDFISWYSNKTGVSVVVPEKMNGTVTLFNYRVDDKNLSGLLDTVLLGMGYGIVPGNPALIISLDPVAPLH